MDRLIRALPTQSQLETVEVRFGGATFRDREGFAITASGIIEDDDGFEPEIDANVAKEMEEYRQMSAITAQMFHPAWASVCRLLEDGHMSMLRYNMARNR